MSLAVVPGTIVYPLVCDSQERVYARSFTNPCMAGTVAEVGGAEVLPNSWLLVAM